MTLKEFPSIAVGDLAVVHQLDQSTITRAIDKMLMLGYVAREAFGNTSRIFLTDNGLEKVGDAMMAWQKLQHSYKRILGVEFSQKLTTEVTQALHQLN